MRMVIKYSQFVVFLVLLLNLPALSKSVKSLLRDEYEPALESVQIRGLVKEKISYRSILREHGSHWINNSHRSFPNFVLGYVTPWNRKGHEIAVKFKSKFSHISPVWYQFKSESKTVQLHGRDEADRKWIDSLREGPSHPFLVPRVVLEGWAWGSVLADSQQKWRAIKRLVNECSTMGYDGIVLEAWSSWSAGGILENPTLRTLALGFVRDLGMVLRSPKFAQKYKIESSTKPLQFIFVIPPPSDQDHPAVFSQADLADLAPAVDAFSMMTYDFSSADRPGPNSPLPWVNACLSLLLPNRGRVLRGAFGDSESDFERRGRELRAWGSERNEESLEGKVLTGLNFYGNDFSLPKGGGPIVGHEYLSLLDKYRPALVWDPDSSEHYFKYGSSPRQRVVYFPSLNSIQKRVELARVWGTGISVWELGQGLDYFYDLL